ncbi:2-polyprenyl-6-methoxyphenol hydroxylase-like FAD-dependent oxidoreductase/alpha-beta hydrolase superfamily lysophospholipase [Allocatelliglobosispora scoriae]|uniref:2-polyprenyl-6-methoxyphenol hydroxylase-like FAD-dependent oxidoreductase/alpha-beta hydrolase superfamily lysophospholipase n=1 Tax=Allocatelliglobosispora scoriae TaxID=643052 RepID=A0A841BIQ8_9ACTN|nr:FAD-dependent monooxygenase [Allocatelliglobosispora scoriae]MBB5866943.1 2-polyprenyl-6-methoxyphenol hydroxylase-like FAD-dependent oxidoreductase/alpha-beta hydrolase superfamily lysophospholipase [Allocatelliglobosispora scoriae]
MSDDPHAATGGRDIHTVRFPAADPPDQVAVLIVGAGPVGLSAAVELTARGVPVAVVDAARSVVLVRAGAMGHSPRTVEHFRRWGLLHRIRAAWTFPPEWNRGIRLVTSLAGHDLVPVRPLGDGPGRFSLARPIRRPQTALQQVFLDHLRQRGVTVAGGWRVEQLDEVGDGVRVTVTETTTGATRTIRSDYVIGADGGSSTVRRLAGIGRDGEHATEKMFRLVVRTAEGALGPAPSGTNIVVNQKASGFLAAISTREWRVYAGPYALDAEPAESELLATARAAFGTDVDLELASATTFYHATRIAQTFRRGRVLLAGDAAHVRTPGGNLGEGFGDVVNLGWKLAAVHSGLAPEALLDSYDAERRPHNWRIADHALDRSRRSRAVLAEIRAGGIPDDADLSPAAEARRAEIGELLTGDGGNRGEAPGVTFDERYDASGVIWHEPGQLADETPWAAAVYEDDPRPGHRAPDLYVDPWGDTLYDRLGDDFGLLVLGDDRTVEHALTAEAAARGLRLTVVHLTDGPSRYRYGTETGSILIRPDQHVAWRGDTLPPGGAAAVLDRILALPHASKGTTTMADYLDFTAPVGLRTRGTVLIVPGRGESTATYRRLGARLAADSYRVRVAPAPIIDDTDVPGSLDRYASLLADAVKGVGEDGPVTPLVLVGADTGAAVVAGLVTRPAPDAAWWPAAVVLAGLPGGTAYQAENWDDELDGRTHCPVHRGVLSDDPSVRPGSLTEPIPPLLLETAYAGTADLPHLLLAGADDPYSDRERLARLAESLPLARLAVVHGGHHDVLNDLQHRTVAAEIVTFLEALRSGPPLAPIIQTAHSAW